MFGKKVSRQKMHVHGESKLNIGLIALMWFVLSAVSLAVATLFIYKSTSDNLNTSQESQLAAKTESLSSQVSAALAHYQSIVRSFASQQGVASLLLNGDEQKLRAMEETIKRFVPDAVRIGLYKAGEERVQASDFPGIGYAEIEMLAAAEKSGQSQLIEAHLINSDHRHFDIVEPVKGFDDQVAGLLLVSFDLKALSRLFNNIVIDKGYFEVQQGDDTTAAPVLFAGGDRSHSVEKAHSAPVPGTRWMLVLRKNTAEVMEQMQYLFIAIGIVMLMLAVITVVSAIIISKFISDDLKMLINIVGDVWQTKRVRSDYPIHLTNFKGTFNVLAGMGEGLPIMDAEEERRLEEGIMGEPGEILVTEGEYVDEGEQLVKPVPGSIFKAYDIRGIVGDTLTEDLVYDIGRAIGSEAYSRGQQSIIVARDGRHSGVAFIDALTRGLRATGRDVFDIGMVPTPVLYFATHYLSTGSGVMVTGSHNPPGYNGFKIVIRGDTLSGEAIQLLRKRIEREEFLEGAGDLQTVDIVSDYIERVVNEIHVSRPLKVVVDCGNGVAGDIAPRLLRALGCDVVELYCDIDGDFPNHHPDPSQPENLQDLINNVKMNSADLGLAFDGDGDRLGVVDSGGMIIWPDRQMMLYSIDVLSRNPGAEIIFDIKCTRHLSNVITKNGGRPLMWKTGHSLIKAKMKETGALLAGEMSGHLFFKERWYGFDDALYAAARLLEIVSARSESTEDIFAALPNAICTPELKVEMAEGEHFKFMKRLSDESVFAGASVIKLDGIRADYEDGWGLVRASNTTPCLVIRFEANNMPALKRIQTEFRQVLLRLEPGLSLPF